jgi:hypothetical protein
MRLIMGFVMAFAALAAHAQSTPAVNRTPLSREDYEKYAARMDRAMSLEPHRRDAPLRDLNISDDEVREIQAIAQNYVPKALVNISPVIASCPCEEGPLCTDQVYIVANAGTKSTGLQLSRIKGVWTVGVVQLWWRRLEELRARRSKMNWDDYQNEASVLLTELPVCVRTAERANKTASLSTAEEKK